jgi:hypothetical protein
MNMRTGANELSNQSLTSASADRTDNQQDDQRDDSVETASKKSDSGIYMDANGETQAWEAHHMDRDDQHQPNDIVQPDSSQDVEASYLEDSASVLSNGTTISSLIDEEEEGKQVYNIETTNPSRLFWYVHQSFGMAKRLFYLFTFLCLGCLLNNIQRLHLLSLQTGYRLMG